MGDDEKILKFAGFTKTEWAPDAWAGGTYKWHFPDSDKIGDPGDTTDLTWLFKWCVPKLGQHRTYRLLGLWIAGGVFTGEALRAAIVALIGEGDE